MMKKICAVSGKEFEITDNDLQFYKKVGVPLPTLCPEERVRRRMSYRNERNLYKTKSAMSGETILSMYHSNTPYPVYTKEEWLSDKWDPLDYGQEIDFNRPFFDQFFELQKKVPRVNLAIFINNENSEYCNYVGDIKNCYLCFGSIFIEDCMYGNPYYSKNCVDSFLVRKSELCYECIDCEGLYSCMYCQECYECSDISFGYDLKGCRNCFGCAGLRKKNYHIFNQPYSKEDYEKYLKSFSFCDKSKVKMAQEKFEELKKSSPRRATIVEMSQNVSGNYIFNSKNCFNCFQVSRAEDCSYNIQTVDNKDCFDMNYTEENELCYEYIGNYRNNLALFCMVPYGCHDIMYSDYLTNCKHCFGCCALRNKEYCIFNKQYKKEEYEELKNRLIEMMKNPQNGMAPEWGEFFPIKNSPFAYNESVAMDYFPLTKENALARGYKWREESKADFKPGSYVPPENVEEVPDSICNEILTCEISGRNYKIMPAELYFYRRMKLSIPRLHFNERHRRRLGMRLPYEIFPRKCAKCGGDILTSYAPERPEIVYCEECYLGAVV